jgi:hypothetical protein
MLFLPAVGTVTIAVGVQDRPAEAPQFGEWDLVVVAVGNPSFAQAMNAIATVVLAFAGTPAFYPVIAEMKDPRDYNKAMGLCQVVVTLVYTIVGVVVYTFCGQYVANPALGSAGPLLKRVAYGLALPALFATVCVRLYSLFCQAALVTKPADIPFAGPSDLLAHERQVHLCPPLPRQGCPHRQFGQALGRLAFVLRRLHPFLLRHCLGRPRLRRYVAVGSRFAAFTLAVSLTNRLRLARPRRSDRCPLCDAAVDAVHGPDLLARRQGPLGDRQKLELPPPRLLGSPRLCHRLLLHRRRHVRRRHGPHQGDRQQPVDVRRQL